jgi:hypothetical protein
MFRYAALPLKLKPRGSAPKPQVSQSSFSDAFYTPRQAFRSLPPTGLQRSSLTLYRSSEAFSDAFYTPLQVFSEVFPEV